MAAFPIYDEARMAVLDEQAAAMLAVLGARGYKRYEPSILQPAEIFLDRSGDGKNLPTPSLLRVDSRFTSTFTPLGETDSEGK